MRQIKRYENRKLYDTEAKQYVSLTDIAQVVRQGETVQVVDNVTEEDITAQTLTQVILEEGKQGRSLIPTDTLHELLRRSEEMVDAGFGQLRHGVNDLVHQSVGRLNRLLQRPRSEEIEQLHQQLVRLEGMLSELIRDEKRVSDEPSEQSKAE